MLQGGAKLVILREEDQHYLRLLMPKDGTPTFVTRKLPLSSTDVVGLQKAPSYQAHFDGLTIKVGDNRAIACFGSLVLWGPRNNLTRALGDIAR